MATEVKALHCLKARKPIDVTESGIFNGPVRLLQRSNANEPIDMTVFGIVTEVKPESPQQRQGGIV